MILCLVGDLEDLNLVYIGWVAEKLGFTVLKLSEDKLGMDWNYYFDDQWVQEGIITYYDKEIKLSDIHGVYVRFNPEPKFLLDNTLPLDEKNIFILERRCAIQNWLNSLRCIVINRPSAGRSNGSKPYQMFLLSQAGFNIPEWIVTNNLEQFKIFQKKFPDGIIYKSCSGLRSHVHRVDSEIINLLKNQTSPVIFQHFVKGTDVRVHIIRDSYFATEIISDGIDYRFYDGKKEFKDISIPESLFLMCKSFAETEGLNLAGFDFRVRNEIWFCLEVNPVPTFLPYEMETGQPIAESILKTMVPF